MDRKYLGILVGITVALGQYLVAEECDKDEKVDMPVEFRNEIAAVPVDEKDAGDPQATDEESEVVIGAAPDECDCGGCYMKVCKYVKCPYEEWVCVNKEVTYEKQHRRFVPEYYQKLRCKYVPQYYYETFCRYVPEQYTTTDTYIVPDRQLVTKYKMVPKYYFKKRPGVHCCEESNCDESN